MESISQIFFLKPRDTFCCDLEKSGPWFPHVNSDAYEFAVVFWDQGGFQIDLLLIVRLLPLVLAFFEMNTCQIIDNSVFRCVCKNC